MPVVLTVASTSTYDVEATLLPRSAVETATAVGVPCVLNPAPVLPGLAGLLVPRPGLRGPLLTPNVGELAALTGPGPTGVRAVGLATRTEAPVVVTLGGEGALVVGIASLGITWQAAVGAVALTATLAWMPALFLGGGSFAIRRLIRVRAARAAA